MPYIDPSMLVADTNLPLVVRHAAQKLKDKNYFVVNDLLDDLSIFDIQSIVDVTGIVCEVVIEIGKGPEEAEDFYGTEVIDMVKGFICLVCVVNQAEGLMPETDDEFMNSIFRFMGIVVAYASGPYRDFEPKLTMSLTLDEIAELTLMDDGEQ